MNCDLAKQPLVSVYIPTKNRVALLERAIHSVLSQTYKNIELIVIDDGSSDETPMLLAKLASQFKKLKFVSLTQSKGAPAARNYALKLAKGQLITGLDDDDFFLPKRIEHLVANFDEKYAFVCSGFYWSYGKIKTKLYSSLQQISLDEQLYFNHASNQVLVLKERLLAVGGFDESFQSCQDWELWTRLIQHYGNGLRIKEIDYVIDASHGNERITDSPNRIQGFKMFEKRYTEYMTQAHRKSMRFNLAVAMGDKLSFFDIARLLTLKTLQRNIKYWLTCRFPQFAKKRLEGKR